MSQDTPGHGSHLGIRGLLESTGVEEADVNITHLDLRIDINNPAGAQGIPVNALALS